MGVYFADTGTGVREIHAHRNPMNLYMAGFLTLSTTIFLIPARASGIPQIGQERRRRTPPDIVEERQEIVDFRSRGGGPVGHTQGVQGVQAVLKGEITIKSKLPPGSGPKSGQNRRCSKGHSLPDPLPGGGQPR